MAKWPEPGRAKTRLTPPLSSCQAAELARCFLLDTLDEAASSDADRLVAFAPACRLAQFRRLVGANVGLICADMTDFGDALRRSQLAAFAMGYRSVALVASDIPHLPAETYGAAFDALETCDVALGPCRDGGYYLLAASRATERLFSGIAWSTCTVFRRTLERAAEVGLSVVTLPACSDVDTAADLAPLRVALSVRPGSGRTLARLQNLKL